MTAEPSTTRLAARLRSAGVRVTAPRVAILGVLGRDPNHPTAEQVYGALKLDHPSLSLSTVYKTLELFLGRGLCRRVAGDGTRLRVDGIADDHDHAVCLGCGQIFDVERRLRRMAAPPNTLPGGLSVNAVRVEYDVVCAACRGEAGSMIDEPADPSARVGG